MYIYWQYVLPFNWLIPCLKELHIASFDQKGILLNSWVRIFLRSKLRKYILNNTLCMNYSHENLRVPHPIPPPQEIRPY